MKIIKRWGSFMMMLLILSACTTNSVNEQEENRIEPEPIILEDNVTVYIVGDSTASPYDEEFAPRAGWGQVFQQFFIDNVTVENKARSGRSSKSYLDEGHFDKFVDEMKENDVLFIQFGHNDQKSEDPNRYTEPFTTYKEHLSVYIDAARERGATPVLLTPINRNKFDGNGKLTPTHGNYPRAMRELAEEKDVLLIDMTEKSGQLFEQLGPDKVKELIFLHLAAGEYTTYPDGVADDTHFKHSGAVELGKLVIEGMKELNMPLYHYVKPEYQSREIE